MTIFFTSYITTLCFIAGGYLFGWRILKERLLAYLGLGWLLNAIYLLLEALRGEGKPSDQLVILAASLLSTMLIHYGAQGSEGKRKQLNAFAQGVTVLVVTVVLGAGLLKFAPTASQPFFLYSWPAALYSMFVLTLVARRLLDVFPEDNYGYSARFLAGSWAFYGVLQVFYPFRFLPGLEIFVITVFCFASGIKLLGGVLLLGLLKEAYDELQRRAEHVSVLEELGQLAAGLHHDIATPLGTIDGALETLEANRADDAVVKSFLKLVDEPLATIEGALAVTNISRLDADAITGSLVRISVQALINRSFRLFKKGVGENLMRLIPPPRDQNIAGRGRSKAERLFVLAQIDHIGTAFLNIIKNAWEAGASRVWVEVEKDGENNHVRINFINDGKMLTEEELASCTKAGWTSKMRTVHKANRGMGLFMVARIIRMHRGELVLKNLGDLERVQVSVQLPMAKRP